MGFKFFSDTLASTHLMANMSLTDSRPPLEAYERFAASNTKKAANEITKDAVKTTLWGRLIAYCFQSRRELIATHFRAALAERYPGVSNFAFSKDHYQAAVTTGLTGGMIQQVIGTAKKAERDTLLDQEKRLIDEKLAVASDSNNAPQAKLEAACEARDVVLKMQGNVTVKEAEDYEPYLHTKLEIALQLVKAAQHDLDIPPLPNMPPPPIPTVPLPLSIMLPPPIPTTPPPSLQEAALSTVEHTVTQINSNEPHHPNSVTTDVQPSIFSTIGNFVFNRHPQRRESIYPFQGTSITVKAPSTPLGEHPENDEEEYEIVERGDVEEDRTPAASLRLDTSTMEGSQWQPSKDNVVITPPGSANSSRFSSPVTVLEDPSVSALKTILEMLPLAEQDECMTQAFNHYTTVAQQFLKAIQLHNELMDAYHQFKLAQTKEVLLQRFASASSGKPSLEEQRIIEANIQQIMAVQVQDPTDICLQQLSTIQQANARFQEAAMTAVPIHNPEELHRTVEQAVRSMSSLADQVHQAVAAGAQKLPRMDRAHLQTKLQVENKGKIDQCVVMAVQTMKATHALFFEAHQLERLVVSRILKLGRITRLAYDNSPAQRGAQEAQVAYRPLVKGALDCCGNAGQSVNKIQKAFQDLSNATTVAAFRATQGVIQGTLENVGVIQETIHQQRETAGALEEGYMKPLWEAVAPRGKELQQAKEQLSSSLSSTASLSAPTDGGLFNAALFLRDQAQVLQQLEKSLDFQHLGNFLYGEGLKFIEQYMDSSEDFSSPQKKHLSLPSSGAGITPEMLARLGIFLEKQAVRCNQLDPQYPAGFFQSTGRFLQEEAAFLKKP